jgi:hypothetical protein
MVALFATDLSVGSEYLKQHNITNVPVLQSSFIPLSVSSTPTLVLVDHNGKVDKAWIGLLDSAQRTDLLGRIGLQEAPGSDDAHIQLLDNAAPIADLHLSTAAEYLTRKDAGNPSVVVDTRGTGDFLGGHLPDAKNIPIDELETRAPHELKTSQRIDLFCRYCGPCENNMFSQGLFTSCTLAKHTLNRLGYDKVGILSDDLDTFKKHGSAIVVSP